jgi:predicted TIM-barrel fold metal-dependent hydrolase
MQIQVGQRFASLTTIPRVDSHVHIDTIDPTKKHHKTDPPTPEALETYVRRENIGHIFAMYESDAALKRFAPVPVEITPVYWERHPQTPQIPASAKGIKLHPFLDGHYRLDLAHIKPTLDVARERGLFVFIHMDDRVPDISRPSLVGDLARHYPDLTFVMGHAGSYAPPLWALTPNFSTADRQRFNRNTWELVSEAVAVVKALPNVYLETSILASDVKARIIARTAPLDKILPGSDFPILATGPFQPMAFQEQQLKKFGVKDADIQRMYQTACRFPVLDKRQFLATG